MHQDISYKGKTLWEKNKRKHAIWKVNLLFERHSCTAFGNNGYKNPQNLLKQQFGDLSVS